jgi:hypothetical protein
VKLVRESIDFERGGDPLTKLDIGIPYKNPMPSLNKYIDNELKNPIEFDFADLNEQMDIARRGLMDLTLAKGMYEEFGDRVISFRPSKEYRTRKHMVLKINYNGKEIPIDILFHPSNEYVSFYAWIPELKNFGKLKGDKSSTGYLKSVEGLARGIRKLLKNVGITI